MATREEQRREYNEQKELESLRRVFDTLDKDKNNKVPRTTSLIRLRHPRHVSATLHRPIRSTSRS